MSNPKTKKPLLRRQSAFDHSALAIPLAPDHTVTDTPPTAVAKKQMTAPSTPTPDEKPLAASVPAIGAVAYKVSAVKFIP